MKHLGMQSAFSSQIILVSHIQVSFRSSFTALRSSIYCLIKIKNRNKIVLVHLTSSSLKRPLIKEMDAQYCIENYLFKVCLVCCSMIGLSPNQQALYKILGEYVPGVTCILKDRLSTPFPRFYKRSSVLLQMYVSQGCS